MGDSMQTITKIKSGIKNSLITALELLNVRLEMAKLEFNEQKEQLIFILILSLCGFLLLLFAGFSLFFALNAWLPEPYKFSVFASISVGCLLLVMVLAALIIRTIRRQRGFLDSTLKELKLDIAAIRQSINAKHN
ncbi:phage holin family protein [Testudinibacter sp. TR-2022]|nr:phage holin family protein [Pasteurellaceae bacterium Phil31]TNH07778.1 phage holin family protein [Testudinibacter sp. TR-2022]TNH09122.1 phage holin family protein [Testudinibacter sp. TR-2022]TNH15559.1 phage holin family protein [Testudinibacter sp. TR-2022]TNH17070.1 phage holin family protein [Testudinibacter sp. TR-2022]